MVVSLLADYAFDVAEPVIIWLTVAVVAALVIAGIVLYFAKREITGKYIKYGIIGFVGYALVMGIVMLALHLAKHMNPGYLKDHYVNYDIISYVIIPLLVLFAVMLVCGIILFVVSEKKSLLLKPLAIAFGALCAAGVVAVAVTVGLYYTNYIVGDGYYTDGYGDVNQTALYVSAAVLVVAAVVAALLLGIKDKRGFDSRCIALAGICIAMSFVLSYVKLWEMPQGGSITFVSLLPVMVYAYIYGTRKGVIVGLIYGIMQAMQDPYIIHPAQFLLDYPIAFAMVGFAGVFKNVNALKFPQIKFALGAILAGVLRFISHVLSGVFAFSAYALDNGFTNYWAYSLAYNSFVFVDIALVVVAGAIIFSSKAFVRQLDRYSLPDKAVAEAAATDSVNSTDDENN